MYAIIQTGGKQYRVESGDVLDVELDAKSDGESVEFDNVLLVGDGDSIQVGNAQGFEPLADASLAPATVH